jgi:hypothetical protein
MCSPTSSGPFVAVPADRAQPRLSTSGFDGRPLRRAPPYGDPPGRVKNQGVCGVQTWLAVFPSLFGTGTFESVI